MKELNLIPSAEAVRARIVANLREGQLLRTLYRIAVRADAERDRRSPAARKSSAQRRADG